MLKKITAFALLSLCIAGSTKANLEVFAKFIADGIICRPDALQAIGMLRSTVPTNRYLRCSY